MKTTLIKCKRCVSLFGEENALIATEHGTGILTEYHLCTEHYVERYRESARIPGGYTCGDCAAFKWCHNIIGVSPTNIDCDYIPCRFSKAKK